MRTKKIQFALFFIFLISCMLLCSCSLFESGMLEVNADVLEDLADWDGPDLGEIDECTDDIPYVLVNDNVPFFTLPELTESGEYYSELDSLGRCGVCVANIGKDLMPTEERGSISMIKPSGWVTSKYDFIDGKYLYNRCHLIGYQLTGENANEKNLITGTRCLNTEAMLPFENIIADYVNDTGNHVLYRVTPVFEGDNLVATGVLLEAESVEDEGETILINIFCYNIQPGVIIDYADGSNYQDPDWVEPVSESEEAVESEPQSSSETPSEDSEDSYTPSEGVDYILNTNSMKFHYPTCKSVSKMSAKNRKEFTGSRDELIEEEYSPCGDCKP